MTAASNSEGRKRHLEAISARGQSIVVPTEALDKLREAMDWTGRANIKTFLAAVDEANGGPS